MDSPENEEITRCEGCNTTWARLKSDGRAGCERCYETFRPQLVGVMARVQRGEFHTGKTPRAARKRAILGQNLRVRREKQLQLLERRLNEAVAAEKYEIAAQLRDKMREISE
ncbi:MAG TPA: UvrB/UvrC motif-containing protein [Abditibacterium sp.]|jgi:protein arginine kinase activator